MYRILSPFMASRRLLSPSLVRPFGPLPFCPSLGRRDDARRREMIELLLSWMQPQVQEMQCSLSITLVSRKGNFRVREAEAACAGSFVFFFLFEACKSKPYR